MVLRLLVPRTTSLSWQRMLRKMRSVSKFADPPATVMVMLALEECPVMSTAQMPCANCDGPVQYEIYWWTIWRNTSMRKETKERWACQR